MLAALVTLGGPALARQQAAIDAGAIFRVFLATGQALPAYGEPAFAGDRVVFTLIVGTAGDRSTIQLVSLPVDRVDVVRTRRYADALRARHYAATRGEVDFAAMTQEVRRALARISTIDDPVRRLELAEDTRRRFVAWSAGTYGYRAGEVRELIVRFDEVIGELRAAAGVRQFAFDLRLGPDDGSPEPLLEPPTLVESVALALQAALAADNESERLAVLRAAESLTAAPGTPPELTALVAREIENEARATVAYAALTERARADANAARRRGDPEAVASAMAYVRERDRALGARRPQTVAALLRELESVLEAARAHRAALDRYAAVRGRLLQYEREVRPVMSGLDGLAPVLRALEEGRFTAYERLERAARRLDGFLASLSAVTPPEDLADVHASLQSAVRMAAHGCARRRLAVATGSPALDREASAAAAGALLLGAQARVELVRRLYPPKVQ